MGNILVINSGSSSIKFRLLAMPGEACLAWGHLDGIDSPQASLQYASSGSPPSRHELQSVDRHAGLDAILARLVESGPGRTIDAVGHRVVHGGGEFHEPLLIDAHAISALDTISALAPLHNAASLAGIRMIRERHPELPQVAVFDSAFHHDLPDCARWYALPLDIQREQRIRRYGFHGLSHHYVATAAAQRLKRPLADLKLISLHLGNGASACAIRAGRSVDTSMGFTPLEGLVMGSRCGDLDPALPGHLGRKLGWDAARVDELLNRQSGLRGLCGDSDMRHIEQRMSAGDGDARLAFELFCYRIRKYIGAYYAVLDGLDALIFTAGIGEHSAAVRAAVCADLGALGIGLDPERNAAAGDGVSDISRPGLAVRILIVPTDEELEIARATHACVRDRIHAPQ